MFTIPKVLSLVPMFGEKGKKWHMNGKFAR